MSLTIRTRVLTGFAASALVTAIVGSLSYFTAKRIQARLEDVAGPKLQAVQAIDAINVDQEVILRSVSTLLHRRVTDPATRRAMDQDAEQSLKEMDEAVARFDGLPRSPDADRLWREVGPLYRPFHEHARALLGLLRERERITTGTVRLDDPRVVALEDRAWDLFLRALAQMALVDRAIEGVADQTARDAAAAREQGSEVARHSTIAIAAAVVSAALALLAVGLYASRRIGRAVSVVVGEAERLTRGVQEGRLGVRADEAAVEPEFRAIPRGMNATMDAFVTPIQVTAECVDRIARGEIPPLVTGDCRGDFRSIQDSLNRCITAVNALVSDAKELHAAALAGELTARADASRHQGDFRRVVVGVNETLDAVTAPVNEAMAVLEKLAARDLCARLEGEYRGDHGRIKHAINTAAEALNGALCEVADAAAQVAAASSQIAASSEQVADSATREATAVAETTSRLGSMLSRTRETADGARVARALAQATGGAAGEGAAAMEQTTGAMVRIRTSAEGTSQIIKDINEIAFQTNLLALNAAVEAARAGSAGRGFAVVAEEVRTLASRSKEAARRTEELIRDSVREAEQGAATAQRASGNLVQIVSAVGKVSEVVGAISTSAEEQAAGIDGLSEAMREIDRATQQNAASAEESSSSAEELTSQAECLNALVSGFQLARERSPQAPCHEVRGALVARA